MYRLKINLLLALLCLAAGWSRAASAPGPVVWDQEDDRVSADVRGEELWPLLEDVAHATGWHIFVEPDTGRKVDVKFKDLPSGEALHKLLGDLNFAFVPKTNEPSQLYVFKTSLQMATRRVQSTNAVVKAGPPRHVPNELIVKLKKGGDIDALAKSVGAKVVGRDDKLGIYRLQFDSEADMEAALAKLKTNDAVAAVDYNYYYDPPMQPQPAANVSGTQPKLTLDDSSSGDPCHPIVAVIDTQVQSLGSQLDQFVMKPVTVVDNVVPSTTLTHGTAMVNSVLDAIAQSSGGHSATKILPVVVYDSGEQTTTWNVALGVQAAVNNGATVLNMSLGGTGDSAVLDDIIQQALAKGIVIFAAAGNQPVNTPTYPAALAGVNAVTALGAPGQLASYANYGSFVSMALPGANVVQEAGQSYMVQGTSTSTAYASGIAAGTKGINCQSWSQIETAMQQKFPVPPKSN
ncbi:MAG TPA: S8 family serine peptidase [Verrucomicrobiae bacterium]|nr:S8 family serine peptidase [Verrucomicrobiae bacterium]